MLLFYCILLLVIGGLMGALVGYVATRRSYRAQLDATQLDAAQAWAEYQEVLAVAARWKRLYWACKGVDNAQFE